MKTNPKLKAFGKPSLYHSRRSRRRVNLLCVGRCCSISWCDKTSALIDESRGFITWSAHRPGANARARSIACRPAISCGWRARGRRHSPEPVARLVRDGVAVRAGARGVSGGQRPARRSAYAGRGCSPRAESCDLPRLRAPVPRSHAATAVSRLDGDRPHQLETDSRLSADAVRPLQPPTASEGVERHHIEGVPVAVFDREVDRRLLSLPQQTRARFGPGRTARRLYAASGHGRSADTLCQPREGLDIMRPYVEAMIADGA